jgi:hypothetical protein
MPINPTTAESIWAAKIVAEQRFVMKKSAAAYKRGSRAIKALHLGCFFAAPIGVLGIGVALPAAGATEPQHGEIAVTCTNPYSGATWRIKIDYDRRTVDTNPAEINEATISWRDSSNGWHYALDRKSGKLTVTVASATGGNFLHDNCKLGN